VTTSSTALIEALGSSQRLGFLGDLPIPAVIAHARHFVRAVEEWVPTPHPHIADIGSGGGVPGLVLAVDLLTARVTMIDRRATRTDHLARLVRRLDLGARAQVVTADLSATPANLVGRFDAVTARGFGPPAVTLHAARPLLRAAGVIVVSEPPAGEPDRWPHDLVESHDLVRCTPPGAEVVVFRAP
jgi:16S rRNA (guanine527-N7)-methyltransferase